MVAEADRHVVLLVGASRGIGAACAHAFAGRGAQVCLVARNAEKLEAVRASLPGAPALIQAANIVRRGDVDRAVRAVLDRFGRIDTMINLAAGTGPLQRPLWSLPPDSFAETMAVNATGPFHLTQAVVPGMLKQGRGLMLFASSPFGDFGQGGLGAYGASRAACNHLVRQLAAELQGSGVAAALVLPGVTQTEGLAAFRAQFGGQANMPPVPAATMANLFLWCAMQAPADLNGATIAWSDPAIRNAVLGFNP